jgi:DNA uptake protein ComE-like DNA-binding protein
MKHLILLLALVFAVTGIANAQTEKKKSAVSKVKTEVQKKVATSSSEVKEVVNEKTPVKMGALPAGAMLDVNNSPKTELMKLPGIGKAYAEKIIQNRPYAKPDDLLTKKIIPKKTFDAIKSALVASPVR